MGHVRHGVVALGLVLALAPLSAYAEDGNQAAIDAAKAEKAWLQGLPAMPQGVVLGQREIANARAIARMLSFDGHAQAEIPNSMEQYVEFCASAVQRVQAGVNNAAAMATARPFDMHAQAELANATAISHAVWDMIGNSYPGNPFYASGQSVLGPNGMPLYSDEAQVLADDEDVVMADDEDGALAEDAAAIADDDPDLVAAAAD